MINAGFPDHHSPSLALMWSLYSIIDFWMAIDEKHVIAVHCLAGKGRTGLSIICTLLMQGFFNDFSCQTTLEVINAAINFFHDKRGDGVENPDQIRFIYHFLKSMNSMGSDLLLSSNHHLQPKIFISDILFYNFPVGIGDSVVLRLEIYVKARNSRDLVYSSDWSFNGNAVIASFQPVVSIRVGLLENHSP